MELQKISNSQGHAKDWLVFNYFEDFSCRCRMMKEDARFGLVLRPEMVSGGHAPLPYRDATREQVGKGAFFSTQRV